MTAPTDTSLPSTVYLGAPGRMLALPSPDGGMSPSGMRYAALTRGLDGTGTETFFGTKRKYSIQFPHCTPAERRWLDMCWDNMIQPLWLIDPLTANRLPKGIAATGSTVRGERGFTTNGNLTVLNEHPEAQDRQLPPRSIQVAHANLLTYDGIPVVAGEELTFSCWLHANTETTASLEVRDTNGTVLGQPTAAPPVPPGSSFTHTQARITVPDGAATARCVLAFDATGELTTNGWYLGPGAGEWTPGGGAMRIAMREKSSTSGLWPLETVSITLEEL